MSRYSHNQRVVISHLRKRCIGCNYCVEYAPERWRMSKKDGKVTMVGGIEKKGIYTIRVSEDEYDSNAKAAHACPMNIIQIKVI